MVPTTVASTPKCASVSTSTWAVRALTSAESPRVGGLAFKSARSGRRYSAPPFDVSKASAASSVGSSVGSAPGSGGSSGGGSAENGPDATTSGYAATPSTGTAGVRSGRAGESTPSSDPSGSPQSAHSMLSIDRRATLPAWRTALPERRSRAPADAPVTSRNPASTSATPTMRAPASPRTCARPPPSAEPTEPPWASPSATISPTTPRARPVRNGRRSTIFERTSISPPMPRSAAGTTSFAVPSASSSHPATCAPMGPPSQPSHSTVATTSPDATRPSPQSSGCW